MITYTWRIACDVPDCINAVTRELAELPLDAEIERPSLPAGWRVVTGLGVVERHLRLHKVVCPAHELHVDSPGASEAHKL